MAGENGKAETTQACLSALPYVASEMVISYAEIDLAMVPAAAPTLKNHLATSCPAPISASTPYHFGFRFTSRACQCRAHVLVADVGILGLLALAHEPCASTHKQSTIDTLAAVLENVDSICRYTTTAELTPGQCVEHLDAHVASKHTSSAPARTTRMLRGLGALTAPLAS